MSLDETESIECEFKELVKETLESNGILSHIRGELRAGLYLALKDQLSADVVHERRSLHHVIKEPEVNILFQLVREFLLYFNLKFTCSVFDEESCLGSAYRYEGREKLLKELNIDPSYYAPPVLLEIVNIIRNDGKTLKKDYNRNSAYNIFSTENIDLKDDVSVESNDANHSTKYNDDVNEESIHTDYDNCSFEKDTDSRSSPSLDLNNSNNNIRKIENKYYNEDTYEETSSVGEDVAIMSGNSEINLIDFDKSTSAQSILNKALLEESGSQKSNSSSTDNSINEKRKLDKTDKLKPMSGLSSLSDLPPIPMTKNRSSSETFLLPSLYSYNKDFRDKSSIKDNDKSLSDNQDNYDDYIAPADETFDITTLVPFEKRFKTKKNNNRSTIKSPENKKINNTVINGLKKRNEGSKDSAPIGISDDEDAQSEGSSSF